MRIAFIRFALLLMGLGTAVKLHVLAAELECINHPKIVAPCRGVHGRISLWNGTPTERIWVIGTNRILGVTSRWDYSMPTYLQKQLDWDVNLYGDFWVCPLFDPPVEGRMDFVCIQSWRNLVREETATATRKGTVKRIPTGPSPQWPGK